MGTIEEAAMQHRSRLHNLIDALQTAEPPNECKMAVLMRDAVVCLLEGQIITIETAKTAPIFLPWRIWLQQSGPRLAWPIVIGIIGLAVVSPESLEMILTHFGK